MGHDQPGDDVGFRSRIRVQHETREEGEAFEEHAFEIIPDVRGWET